jgi:hypothetical protein
MSEFGSAKAALRKQRLDQAARQARSIGGTQDEDTGAGPSHWRHLDATNVPAAPSWNPPMGWCAHQRRGPAARKPYGRRPGRRGPSIRGSIAV